MMEQAPVSRDGRTGPGDAENAQGTGGGLPPPFVLVHGAWHGGWCWERVVPALESAGHKVFTPTMPGLAERADLLSRKITLAAFVDDIVNLIESEDLTDVILVGHSFGGIGITGAAERLRGRIRHLVYLDAMVLQDGQSAFSIMPAEVAEARRKLAQETSDGVSIPVPDPSAFGVNNQADAEWIRSRCTPHPLSTYEDVFRLRGEPGQGIPATYIAVKPDYMPLAAVRKYARSRADWRYMEMEAGHDAMVTSPVELGRLLLEAAAPGRRS